MTLEREYTIQTSIRLGNSTINGERVIPHDAWVAVSCLQQTLRDHSVEANAKMEGTFAVLTFDTEADLIAAKIII